jgi:glycosyltransferase involved in cell wall biosynthesis
MAKPLITGDAPSIRRFLNHGEHIYLCERENSQSLAEAIRTLREDATLRGTLSKNGYDYYKRNFTIDQLGLQLEQHLSELLAHEG